MINRHYQYKLQKIFIKQFIQKSQIIQQYLRMKEISLLRQVQQQFKQLKDFDQSIGLNQNEENKKISYLSSQIKNQVFYYSIKIFQIDNKYNFLKILGALNFLGNQGIMIWGFVQEFSSPIPETYLPIQIFQSAYLLIAIFLYLDVYVFAALLLLALPFILIYICYTCIKQNKQKQKTNQFINHLKKSSIKYIPGSVEGDPECRICMQSYSLGAQVIILPCNALHHFDKNCISTWLAVNPSCPLCRKDFVAADVDLEQPLY